MRDPLDEKVLRVFLVRHGQTDWNKIHRFQGQPGVRLNKTGRAQAEALALSLREEALTVIYSSPLARAVETAEAINRYQGVPIERRDGLMEMNLGDFEGFQSTLLREEHPEFFDSWSKDPASVRMPHGETLLEVQQRAWAVVEEIAGAHAEGSVLLCGHHFVNLTILCKVVGLDLNHFRRLRQAPGAINIIERGGGRYSLVCINDTCHLKAI